MIRGTTPTHTFELPFDTSMLSECYITYAQGNTTRFEKSLSDCELGANTVSVTLSQEETLSLRSGIKTEIQLTVKIDDVVQRSEIIQVDTDRILKEAVI